MNKQREVTLFEHFSLIWLCFIIANLLWIKFGENMNYSKDVMLFSYFGWIIMFYLPFYTLYKGLK